MNRIVLSTTLSLAAFTPFAMRGQDLPDNPNRFSFGPTFGMNFKADFNNNANPGPAAGDANHTYNNGYVLVDSSGDAGGLTTYWGYQNASQVVGGAMKFTAFQSNPSSVTGDPQYGGELIYQRVIGSLPFLSGDWGFEAGFNFTELDLRENLNGTAYVDSFPLNGVLPPGAGYNGTFSGPGALLGDTTLPAFTRAAAALTGYQKLSGQMFSLRLGPFAEWKLTHKLSLAASVGLTLAPTMVDYDFSETATLPGGGGAFATGGHSSKTKLLYGPYVGAMLRYDFNKHWGVYVGARFQNLTDLSQSIGGRTARLDPGATVYGTVGASWKF
jgi:hypothetical protein